MWSAVELREIRACLALADELHFARAAERVGVSASRVSQMIRSLETKLGTRLFDRTSRRVSLTEQGRHLISELEAAEERLTEILKAADRSRPALRGRLRIGLQTRSGWNRLLAIIDAFERLHPGCEVEVSEPPVNALLGSLRRGELDMMVFHLPLDQPDVVVGPELASEPRVLAVAAAHKLAARASVSVEELAEHRVAELDWVPRELMDTVVPRHTPSGRPIPRIRTRITSITQLATLIARERIVHPTVASFAEHVPGPGIAYVPIDDMPPMSAALIWTRGRHDQALRAFARLASDEAGS